MTPQMQQGFHYTRPAPRTRSWLRLLGRERRQEPTAKPLDRLDRTTLAGRLPDGFSAHFGVSVEDATLPCVIIGQRGLFVADAVRRTGPEIALATAAMRLANATGVRAQPLYLSAGLTTGARTMNGVEIVGLDDLRSFLLANTDGRLDWTSFKRIHAMLDAAAA